MGKEIIAINIRDYLNENNYDQLGEEYLKDILSEFSCTKNLEVENFLKNNAIEFTKKHQSVTYLVFSLEGERFLGYFTLAIKPVSVKKNILSKSMIRKIKRIGKYDKKTGTYTFSAYLIAQLGKNFNCANGELITGDDLLKLAFKMNTT